MLCTRQVSGGDRYSVTNEALRFKKTFDECIHIWIFCGLVIVYFGHISPCTLMFNEVVNASTVAVVAQHFSI